MKIEITELATEEIGNIRDFIARVNSIDIANKIANRIYDTIEELSLYAKYGTSVKNRFNIESDLNYFVALPYPYLVFYKIKPNKIVIIHVIDGRRDYLEILSQ